jgi:hypothetical protein
MRFLLANNRNLETASAPFGASSSNRCAYCHGKFGLVRYHRGFKSFCSKACVDRHIVRLRGDLRKRRGWLDRLYSTCFSRPVIKHRAEAASIKRGA